MADGIRTGDPRGFKKGRSSKFREGSRVRQTPEESQMTCRPKRCGNNNPKTLNDKMQQFLQQFLVDVYCKIEKMFELFFFSAEDSSSW